MLAYTSASTAKRWLKKMGFVYSKFAKGVYVVKMISDFGIENEKLIVQ